MPPHGLFISHWLHAPVVVSGRRLPWWMVPGPVPVEICSSLQTNHSALILHDIIHPSTHWWEELMLRSQQKRNANIHNALLAWVYSLDCLWLFASFTPWRGRGLEGAGLISVALLRGNSYHLLHPPWRTHHEFCFIRVEDVPQTSEHLTPWCLAS